MEAMRFFEKKKDPMVNARINTSKPPNENKASSMFRIQIKKIVLPDYPATPKISQDLEAIASSGLLSKVFF